METVSGAPLCPKPQEARRNPLACVLMTAVLAATFWLGMIWLAARVFS